MTRSVLLSMCALVVGGLGCQPKDPDASGGSSGTGGATAVDRSTGGSVGSGGAGTGGSPAASGGSAGVGTGGAGAAGAGGSAGGGSGGATTDTAAETAPAEAGNPGPPGAPSAGCGQNNPGGMFTIMAGAAQTPYRVVLPTMYNPAKPYPLIFYLHGRGNGIEGQGNLNRDVAGANLGIVVYPKSFGGSGWEVPGRDKPDENLAILRALIKHMATQYCVDTTKVIMTGFSSGCWFSSRLACTMKDELAGVVAAACGLDGMGRCMDQKPLTYIIGRGDAAFAGAATATEFYRTRNGCQMTRKPTATVPCEVYDGCAAGAPATYCAHAGGHMWPGFASKAVTDMLEKLP